MRIVIINNAIDECDKYYYINSRRFIYSKANQYNETVNYTIINIKSLSESYESIKERIAELHPDEIYVEFIYGSQNDILNFLHFLAYKFKNVKVYVPDFDTDYSTMYTINHTFKRYKEYYI